MKNYDESFKIRIVQLLNAGKSVKDITEEFGIVRSTIYKWKKIYGSQEKLENSIPLSEAEIKVIELEKKLAQAELENDILKQAALIIGRK